MKVLSVLTRFFHTAAFYLRLITPLLRKGRIRSPERSDILVWDASASDFLSEYVLKDIHHTVLHTREEFYYIVPYLKSLCSVIRSDLFPDTETENDSGLISLYFLECIRCIGPKVVVTFVDNDRRFYRASAGYPGADFFAVQNGVRIMNDSREYSSSELEKFFSGRGEDYSCSDFFCFGWCEVGFYQKYGARIRNYHPVGALKGSWYKYGDGEPGDRTGNTCLICLVSQYRSSFYREGKAPRIYSSLVTLEDFLRRFITETGLALCIAAGSSREEESDHFSGFFGEMATIIPNDQRKFSTYQGMDQSQVIISFYSTAALEAFGWGKKVLFCNYSGDPAYGFPLPDLCYTDIADYGCFREKLLTLLGKDEDEYRSSIRIFQTRYMNYDPACPATSYLRSRVLERISDRTGKIQ